MGCGLFRWCLCGHICVLTHAHTVRRMCADTGTPPMCADTGTPPDMLVPLQQQACLFMRMIAVILLQCAAAFQALPAHCNVQADQLRRGQLAAAQVMQWLILLCA